jgi:CRISPR-associated protein (TIGR02584 family)
MNKQNRSKAPRTPKPQCQSTGSAQGDFGQTVLLAVTGVSPAILTETVWALARNEHPPIIPDRVIVVTTTTGKICIERELLQPSGYLKNQTVWDALRLDLLGPSARNDPRLIIEEIRVLTAPNSRTGRAEPLDDIRKRTDNAAVADFLLEEVRRLIETPDLRLIASIAGGRKTMGTLLYACLTLLGRETDRLTHVLVSEPFETRLKPPFYFPTQPCIELARDDGSIVRASGARIDLADIPFVPIRNLFERDLVKKPATFNSLVQQIRKDVAGKSRQNLHLTIHRHRPEFEVDGISIATSPKEHVFMLFLAERAIAAEPPLGSYRSAFELLQRFSEKIYASRDPHDLSDWRWDARYQADPEDHERICTKQRNQLKAKLRRTGAAAAALDPLLPVKGRFSLDLPPDRIQIVE